MDDSRPKEGDTFSVRMYRLFVLTPISVHWEWLLFTNLALHAFCVSFFRIGIDYDSALVAYLLGYFSEVQIGAALFLSVILSLLGTLSHWTVLRYANLLVNLVYMLVYAGAIIMRRPLPLSGFLLYCVAAVTILTIIKIVHTESTHYKVR